MAYAASNTPPIPSGSGRAFFVGGSIVLAGLSGFYINMLHNKRIQERTGTNPHFEQIVANVSKPVDNDNLPLLKARYGDVPPHIPVKEHTARHSTLDKYKQSLEYADDGEAMRRMEPTPQRPHTDGSGRAYSKSPDYVKNYNKTRRPIPREATAAVSA